MEVPAFTRTYHIRGPQIMWFLGAGASAAANIPTAGAMVWDFKKRLYCSAQRISLDSVRDLGSPEVRARLQAYFDGQGAYPPIGDSDEYPTYFEAVYPDEGDRRRYIHQLVERGVPSFGHAALAALIAAGTTRVVWTTNFDRVVEDAVAPALGAAGRLTVATLDSAHVAVDAINEGRWPLLVKLHGDFHSRRLKNTREELREQDVQLRRALVQTCRTGGLAVIGFSGRDDSVMRAFEATLEDEREPVGAFPGGLFWFHRGSDGPPAPRVVQLLGRAQDMGVDAHLIEVETFDELMGDVVFQLENAPDAARRLLDGRPSHVSDAPIPLPGEAYPVIRLNALPILEAPEVTRLVVCEIGNTRETRDAVQEAGAALIVARKQLGVLAFGADTEVKRVFGPYNITSLDLHPLEARRLWYADSAEMGMLLDALTRGLARTRPLVAHRRRGRYVLAVDPGRVGEDLTMASLRRLTRALNGSHQVPTAAGETQDLQWSEALSIRIESRLGRLWLLLEPTVWMERAADDVGDRAAGDFIRERRARRYNQRTSELLDAWSAIITGGADKTTVSTFGFPEGDGVDAHFVIERSPAFSRSPRLPGGKSLVPRSTSEAGPYRD